MRLFVLQGGQNEFQHEVETHMQNKMEETMNAQEMERRFLGNFIHTLAIDEQVSWLQVQPEIEQALNAWANGEPWMTTPFAHALDVIRQSRAQQIALNPVCEQPANHITLAQLLNEATLPHGVVVTVSPRHVPLDTRLEHRVALEFLAGNSVIARYNLDPKVGKGRLAASYKKFVREHLTARLANCAARS